MNESTYDPTRSALPVAEVPRGRRRLAVAAATLTALGLGATLVAPAAQAADDHGRKPAHASAPAIPFTTATVTRGDDGTFTINWSAARSNGVTVYAGRTQDGIDYRHPVAHGGTSATVEVKGLGAADRWWFRLVPRRGEGLTLADRSLHLASAPNFLDAGGYRTSDGQWVRMGVVYRSGDLSKLTAADLAELRRLGIHTVYDLRTDAERTASPDQVPAGATDIQENVVGSISGFNPTTAAQAEQMMVDGEAQMVDSQQAQTAYHGVFTGLAQSQDLNALYHCSAGKDRTGWASATLLTALGVPRNRVEQDYLASNQYLAASNAATLASMPAAQAAIYKPLLDVRPEYLANGFAEVHKNYGSFDAYLAKGLGLGTGTLKRLKAELLVG
ncbi:protein-tyrosine phosphatase [Actinacidiphila yanglinensis]|uniref:Protein-tyrosine phosphatase n=1 Tax=Actinacidiphila yanglinensis TaxID=310779 RepID=A0A1H5XNL9_9ACTN|nr:tyrosine-protein phosphatase [Actinacidiphila yanglinensis]SEG13282.1 protein-tyrosine phosphatase [Actinacidiphila yanglinensis]